MKMFRFRVFILIAILGVTLMACSSDDSGSAAANSSKGSDSIDLGETDLTLPYVTWASSEAGTFVMKAVLEDLGYNIDVEILEPGVLFAGIADGSDDLSVGTVTLPTTHEDYWEEFQDQIDDVNVTLDEGITIGLAVPEYMDIDSLEDLNKNTGGIGDQLDWNITGIDPGAGQMEITEHEVMPGYDLDKWTLESSSDSAMAAELKDAIDEEEPIVVTLWEPHWAFIEWDLKYLEDPDNLFGDPDSLHGVAREGLEEDSPAAYKVLSQFEWTPEDMGEVMVDIHDGMEPEEAAQKWVDENQDKVEEWTEGIDIG